MKLLENIIAYHCGPALAGIKPANIVTCYKSRIAHIHREMERLNFELNPKDIYIEILCECEERALVIIYRKKVLKKHLGKAEIQEFLMGYGYDADLSVEEYINQLKEQFRAREFPHEIGVFLGYPLHDIRGFIHHRDEGCLLVGEWKVYGDAENAKKLFLRYKACRKALIKRVENGKALSEIFCTV